MKVNNSENINPLVSVSVLAYNHESFIRECLDGIMMQKTNFKFEVLIHDDASTDNTTEIIKEYEKKYPNIIKPIYQTENQHQKKIGIDRTFQFPRARGKYIALCEGDDYWTDPLKLQKQVNFLEEHKNFVGTFTNCDKLYDDGTIEESIVNTQQTEFVHEDIPFYAPTLTLIFRNIFFDHPLPKTKIQPMGGDIFLLTWLLKYGKIGFQNFVSGVYRQHKGGVWSGKNEFGKKFHLLKTRLAMYEIANSELKRKLLLHINNIYHDIAKLQITNEEKNVLKELLIETNSLFNQKKTIERLGENIAYFVRGDDILNSGIIKNQTVPLLVYLSRIYNYKITLYSIVNQGFTYDSKQLAEFRNKLSEDNIDLVVIQFTTDINSFFKTLISSIKEKKISLVHCRSYYATEIGLVLKKYLKLPVIFDIRGIFPEEQKLNMLYQGKSQKEANELYKNLKKMEMKLIFQSDASVVLNRSFLAHIEKTYGSAINTAVIKNFVDNEKFKFSSIARRKYREKLNWNEGVIFVYSGAFSPWYDLQLLSQWIEAIHRFIPQAKFLILTYRDINTGMDLQTMLMKDLKQKFESSLNIVYSSSEEMPNWLSASDIALIPHNRMFKEILKPAQPVKFAEFIANGLRVVALNFCDEITDFISTNAVAGVILNEKDDLIPQLLSIVNEINTDTDYSKREKVAKLAEHYSILDTTRKYKSLYESLIKPELKVKNCLLKIIYITLDSINSACPEIRVNPILHHLAKEEKVNYKVIDLSISLELKISQQELLEQDIIIIQRNAASVLPIQNLRKLIGRDGPKIVYEFDDAFDRLPLTHPHYPFYKGMVKNFYEYIQNADGVIVSTNVMKDYYGHLNKKLIVIKNVLNDQIWGKNNTASKNDDKVRILLAGTPTHSEDIKQIDTILIKILKDYGNRVELFIWGVEDLILQSLPNVHTAAPFFKEYSAYVDAISQMNIDFALVPLQKNDFNMAKSHIKWLEYSAVGIPGIYQDIPSYKEVIRDGENGVLATENPKDWESAIITMIENEDYRTRIAKSAFKEVWEFYTAKDNANHWLEYYKSIMVENEPKVSIIIPVYNKLTYTEKCIQAIIQNTKRNDYEIVIVDNNSTDGTKEYLNNLANQYSFVRFITNNQNLGFAKANNQGAKIARGKYLLFLNNDTEVTERWLEPLFHTIEHDPSIGVLGSKLLFPNNMIQHAGIIITRDLQNNEMLAPWHIHRGKPMDYPEANIPYYYQAVSGACLFIPVALFRELGGFDEEYRNGYEDVDLCFRVRQAGYHIVYQPASVVIHYESQSGDERFAYMEGNKKRLYDKWLANIEVDVIKNVDGRVVEGDNLYPKPYSNEQPVKENTPEIGYWTFEPDNFACPQIRLKSPLQELEKTGKYSIRNIYYEPGRTDNQVNAQEFAGLDILIIQRQVAAIISYDTLMTLFPVQRPKIILEFDDAFALDEPDNTAKQYHRFVKNFRGFLTKADLVTVSTRELKSLYQTFNSRIKVLPNMIDETIWAGKDFQQSRKEKIRILLAGTLTHKDDYQIISGALNRINDKYHESIEIIVWGQAAKLNRKYKNIEIKELENDYHQYAQKLQSLHCDIALVPLIDNKFNRAKSNIKWLEYSYCGIAGIFSDVLPYRESVIPGETGLLVSNDEKSWYEAIKYLIENPEQRFEIATNAKKAVEKEFILSNNHSLWDNAYSQLLTNNTVTHEHKQSNILVSIIIPVFNKLDYTKRCIDSIINETPQGQYELIIVDNNSTDGTKEYLDKVSRDYDFISVIHNEKNLGFSGANNQAAKKAKGKYLLLLNNDTKVHYGWFEPLVELLDKDEKVAAVGSKLLFEDGTLQHAGVVIMNDKMSGDPLLPKHIYYKENADKPEANIKRSYQALTVACLMVRKELFDSLNGFDEEYWNGYEDVDLCLKVRRQGIRVVYTPKSILIHYESKSEGRQDKMDFNRRILLDTWGNELEQDDHLFLLQDGERLFKQGYIDEAKQIFEQVLLLYPNQIEAQNKLNIIAHHKSKLKIGFLAIEPNNFACPFLRLESPLTYLHEKGDIEYINLYNLTKDSVNINLKKLTQLDIIIIQRQMAGYLPFNELVKHIRRDKTKIIYEIDDLLSNLPLNHIGYRVFSKQKQFIEEYIKNADLVTVSTAKLKSLYSNLNNNIVVLPNSIDMRVWVNSYAKNKKNDRIRILFSGTITHGADLQIIEEVIIKTIKEFGDKVTFFLWGNTTEKLNKYSQIEKMQFLSNYLEYVKCLKELNVDFAVVPLENSSFNQAKSNIKWLEYSIFKIPGIYSKSSVYSDYIEDGKTGILVENTQDAWYNAMRKLIIDEDFRLNIGRQAYEEVLKHYTLEHNAHLWLEAYNSLFPSVDKKENTSCIDVSIIIPVYNRLEFTKKCIDSIYKNTNNRNFEIIIIDNASTDGTKDYLEKLESDNPNIKVIRNDKNIGFAKANNQGVKIARGNYIVFLNNDTEPQQGWLSSMLEIIDDSGDIGAVGSKLLYPDNTIQHAGIFILDDRKNGDPLLAKNAYVGKPANFPEANIVRCYQALTAASLLVKKSVFKEIGGFDEGYWNGYEDVDFCFKLQEKGYKLVYQPKSMVIHYESQSGNERFKKVSHNIQRLHSKWLGKITPDFVAMKDGTLQKTKASKILPYKIPSRQIVKHTDIYASTSKFVSIIILTYNALEYTQKCVDSILNHTHYPYEIIFVDNGSTDGTKRYLRNLTQKHHNFKLIANKTNRGFAVGNNQGVKLAKGEYILLLNNDVLVSNGWLKSMVTSLDKDEKIGMIGPLTNYISGRQQIAKIPYNDDNGFHEFARQVRQINKNKLTPRRRIAGFAVLMKKSLYEEIGGLDESYGTGNYEDDDLCLKVREKGYAIMVDESTYIHHYGSQTFKSNKINYKKSLEEKSAKFKEKWPEVDYEELLEIKNPLTEVHSKLLEQASSHLLNGNPAAAACNFEQVIKENPISEDALLGLAFCARQKKDNATALKHLKRLIELDPNNASAYNQAGIISAEYGDLNGAKTLFIAAIKKDPTFTDAQRNLGDILLKLEDYEKGVKVFQTVLNNHPDDVPTLIRMARLYSEIGKKEEARQFAERVLKYDPDNKDMLEFVNVTLL